MSCVHTYEHVQAYEVILNTDIQLSAATRIDRDLLVKTHVLTEITGRVVRYPGSFCEVLSRGVPDPYGDSG